MAHEINQWITDVVWANHEINLKVITFSLCPKEHKVLKILNTLGRSRLIPTRLEG